MSFRTRAALTVILATGLAIPSLAWLQRERIAFVGRCWSNGNRLAECQCTFNALAELPVSYRSLAVSWAHDSAIAYAATVMRLMAAETWRVGASRVRQAAGSGDKPGTLGGWVRMIATKIGGLALQQADPAVASALGSAVSVRLVGDAANELATAQRVLGRHCGTGDTLIVQINDHIRAMAEFR